MATKNAYAFTYAMPQLAPRLDEALRLKALDTARGFSQNERRPECLAVLVEHLPPEMQAEVTEEALAATKLICDGYYRDETLCRLLEYLCTETQAPDPGVLNWAEEVAMGMRTPSARNTAICAVLPHMTGEKKDLLARMAIEAAKAISDDSNYFRVRAYLRVLPFLSGPQLEETRETALTQALAFPNAESRTDLIAGFAPFLVADRLSPLLEEALGTALRELQTKKDKDSAVHGYCHLIENIPEPYASEVTSVAFGFVANIATEQIKGQTLERIATHLPGELLPRALDMACGIQHEYGRATALEGLAPRLEGMLLQRAIGCARQMKNEEYRSMTLTQLQCRLPDRPREEVLASLESLYPYNRIEATMELLPTLTGQMQFQVLAELPAVVVKQVQFARGKLLRPLAIWLRDYSAGDIHIAWEQVLPISANTGRADLLGDIGALAPLILSMGGEQALMDTVDTIQDVCDWWP
ncbi:MAG: hypothetical protein GY731_08695 [Gammaproteobacteria bacterium]|nr:hypothetical protein [Gammaproteobacteria bacterium]